jgi:glycerol-3-phosphate dehydrogenase (NAD(P)+)|tara:strand:- start:2548 stop:3540 length:993 start_codon:yes stop_codon:yes gene_type:complete
VTFKVAVVGGGSWGTTVAHLVSHNTETKIWCRDAEVARSITRKHRNTKYLGRHRLHPDLEASNDLEEVVSHAQVILMAIPSQSYREVFRELIGFAKPEIPIISLAKGLEQQSQLTMTQLMEDESPGQLTGVLTGPNLAAEVLSGYATASVVAMQNQSMQFEIAKIFSTDTFRVYTSRDVIGCELGGAFKNVLALAVGMTTGLGTGDNTRAAVVTRGLAELARLGSAMGGLPETFSGLAGLGDLVATCFSPQSRNRYVGEQLGKGRDIQEVLSEMSNVAEGVVTAPVVSDLAKEHGVETPISDQVAAVVRGVTTPADAYDVLLLREQGSEH